MMDRGTRWLDEMAGGGERIDTDGDGVNMSITTIIIMS